MNLGVYLKLFKNLSLEEAFAYVSSKGIKKVEILTARLPRRANERCCMTKS